MVIISGIYLSCTMAITTMAMVTTVFVLNLYSMREKPVPPWAKKVFIVYTARILCMCNCATPYEARAPAATTRDHIGMRAQAGADAEDISGLAEEDQSGTNYKGRVVGGNHGAVSNGRQQHYDSPGSYSGGRARVNYSKDWVRVATVCDRLFFWVCLIFIVATTLVLFHPLITARSLETPS